MRGDEKCPFSGATDYGSVWSKGAGKRGVESAVTGSPYNVVMSYHKRSDAIP